MISALAVGADGRPRARTTTLRRPRRPVCPRFVVGPGRSRCRCVRRWRGAATRMPSARQPVCPSWFASAGRAPPAHARLAIRYSITTFQPSARNAPPRNALACRAGGGERSLAPMGTKWPATVRGSGRARLWPARGPRGCGHRGHRAPTRGGRRHGAGASALVASAVVPSGQLAATIAWNCSATQSGSSQRVSTCCQRGATLAVAVWIPAWLLTTNLIATTSHTHRHGHLPGRCGPSRAQALICLAPVPPEMEILRGLACSAIGTRKVSTPAS